MKSSRYYHGNKKLKKRKPEYYIENDNKRRKRDLEEQMAPSCTDINPINEYLI